MSILLFVGLGFLLCALAFALYYAHRAAEEKRRNDRRSATRKKQLDVFYTSSLQELAKVDIAANQDEIFYYAGFAEWEPCPSGARPQDLAKDPGMLYLSNQRLCFVGALGLEERMAFGSWSEAKIHPSAIELRFRDGKTIFIYSDDIMLEPIFGRLVKKQFAPLHS